MLNQWVVERADDHRFFYGRQTGNPIDPRSQSEDLGNDAMYASELGLKNLEVITNNLMEWIGEEGQNYEQLNELYTQILGQWSRYMGHVTSNVGGVYEDHKTFEQDGAVYTPVPRETQKRAMAFLDTHAFSAPTWQFNNEILGRVNQATVVEAFRGRQVSVLNRLTEPARIGRLIDYERRVDGTYSSLEFMDDVRNSIWKELRGTAEINVHRRALQRAYIERMEYLMTEEMPSGGFFELQL